MVRHVTQLILGACHGARQQHLLTGYTIQMVLNLVTVSALGNLPGHHELHPQHTPVTRKDFVGPGRIAQHVLPGERSEHAGVAQVVTCDLRQILGQWGTALPAEGDHGNGCGAIGTTGNFDGGLSQRTLRRAEQSQQDDPVSVDVQ